MKDIDVSGKAVDRFVQDAQAFAAEHNEPYYARLSQTLITLRSALTDREAKLAEAEKRVEALEAEAQGYADNCDNLQSQLSSAEVKLAEAEKEIEAIIRELSTEDVDAILIPKADSVWTGKPHEAVRKIIADLQSQLAAAEARALERAASLWRQRIANIKSAESDLVKIGNHAEAERSRRILKELQDDLADIEALITSPMPSQRERELAPQFDHDADVPPVGEH